jgi:hypothetical protein
MRKTINSLSFVLLFFFLLACGSSDQKGIEQVLNQRAEALGKKDLALYLSCVSKSYQDKGEDVDRLRDRIGGYFQTFDRIAYACKGRSIQIEGTEAAVIQEFQMEVERGGRKRSHSGKEALLLRKESGQWRIVGGL